MFSNSSNDVPSPEVSNRKESGRKPWVFVGNLTEEISEMELHSIFSHYGQIIQIFLNLGFASVQMATQEGAAGAVKHLDGFELYEKKIAVKLVSEGTSVKINTSPTSIKVKDLSPMVTNELLCKAFSQFGQVERAVVIVDKKGRSTTRGIVEFSSELSAQNAVKQIEENLFLITTSPRPISAKIIEQEDSIYGLSEEKIIKTTEYHRETMKAPRFAAAGSFEQQIAQTWKIRYQLERQQREQVEENIERSRKIFEEQLLTCFTKQQAAMKIKQEVLSHSEQKVEEQRKKELEARKRVRMETQVAETSQRNTDETPSKIKKIILPASTSHNNFIEERNNEVSLITIEPGLGHKRHLSNEDEKEPHKKKRRELNKEENGETSSRETSSVVLWDGHKVANNGEVVPYETAQLDNKRVRIELEQCFTFTNGKAQCQCITDHGIICDAIMYPSTHTLKRHLKRKHIETFERCISAANELSTNIQSQTTALPAAFVSSSSSIPQSSNEVSATKTQVIIKKKSTRDAKDFIMGLVVDKEVPLNFFENEQWKKYMGEELKKLGVSTNRDAIKTMLAEREKKRQKNLTNIMKNKSMFLKIDSCKRHLTKYFAVSAQFFDSMDMKVHYFTLGISEITETSVNLKHLVEKSMKKFEIHHKQVIAVVSNNAANIIEAVQQLSRADVELAMEEEDDNTLESLFLIEHVRCAAHTLQLAIRDGLRTCGFAIVIAEIRDICKSSRSSGIASDWRNMGQPPLSVDMATRWGSTFVMIDGAIKAKNTIQTLEARHPELYMNEEKWAQLVVVRDALEPAYATTKAIQSLSLSPGEFFYKWKLLEHTLTRLNSVVSQRIAEEMTARASQLFENDVLLAGIYIDLKSRDLLSTEEQQRGKTCFIDLALHLHLTAAPSQPSASSSTPGETSSQRSTSSPTLSDETQSPLVEPCAQESFEEQLNVKAQERINQKQQHDRMELIQYKRMITQQIEVLETQDRNKGLIESISEYPPVLQQACLVTSAMPTTSVSVERLFWYVKFIKSDKRPDLDEESLNGLVFLKTNGID